MVFCVLGVLLGVDSRKIIEGGSVLVGARVIHNLIGILGFIAVARILTPADVGVASLAMSWRRISEAIIKLPVKEAVIQKNELSPSDFNKSFALKIYRGLASFFILVFIAAPILWSKGQHDVSLAVLVLSLYPLIMAFENPYFWDLERRLEFKPYASVFVLAQFLEYLVVITIAVVTKSYLAIAIGFVTAGVVNCAFSYIIVRKRPRFVLVPFGKIWSFSIWMALGRSAETLSYQIERVIVGSLLGPAFLGVFRASKKMTYEFITFADSAYERAVFAGLSRIHTDRERLKRAYLFSQKAFMIVVLPIGVFFGAMAEVLVPAILGEKWMSAIPVAQIVAPMSALARFRVPSKSALMATGRTKVMFVALTLKSAVFLCIMIFGIRTGTIEGYLYSYATAVFLMLFTYSVMVKVLLYIPLRSQFLNLYEVFLSVLIMYAVIYSSKGYVSEAISSVPGLIVTMLVLGFGSYFTSIYVLWVIAKKPFGSVEARGVRFCKKMISDVRKRALNSLGGIG